MYVNVKCSRCYNFWVYMLLNETIKTIKFFKIQYYDMIFSKSSRIIKDILIFSLSINLP